MSCGELTNDLVELARRGAEPDAALRAHLLRCARCGERWEAERDLTSQLRIIRERAAALGSPQSQRQALMRDFARIHRRPPVRMAQPGFPKWIWAMGAAAALLLAIFAGQVLGKHSIRRVPTRAVHNRGIRTDRTVLYEASASYDDQSDIDDSVFLSGSSGFPNGSGGFPDNEAVALSNDGFITVPYSPPLAPGEMVRVVHTDLYPESLASMGVEVDPAWTGELPADVAVGEDGLPRAVRITGNGQNY